MERVGEEFGDERDREAPGDQRADRELVAGDGHEVGLESGGTAGWDDHPVGECGGPVFMAEVGEAHGGQLPRKVSAAVVAPALAAARVTARVSVVEPVWLMATSRSPGSSMRAVMCWTWTSAGNVVGSPIVIATVGDVRGERGRGPDGREHDAPRGQQCLDDPAERLTVDRALRGAGDIDRR